MSQSATPTTRNEATKRWKPPKVDNSGHGHTGIARTVANGCEREPQRRANTPSNPQTPRVKRETLTSYEITLNGTYNI